ncbi:MAG: polysaccharide deacetylase family protein [candidate division KSB1 bacterium]|nr:polysaccharide deacetylase family protein [candidate division KSB1 bacterium]
MTFDDGPHPEYTPAVLDILKDFKAKATFFLIGSRALQYPQLVRRIAEEGHLVGSHSFSHEKLIFKSISFMRQDIARSWEVVQRILRKSPRYFRPPYGLFDPRVLKVCNEMGCTLVMWNFMSHDYRDGITREQIIWNIETSVGNGTILVFHDGHRNSWKTLDVLPIVMNILAEERLQPSTLESLCWLDKKRGWCR